MGLVKRIVRITGLDKPFVKRSLLDKLVDAPTEDDCWNDINIERIATILRGVQRWVNAGPEDEERYFMLGEIESILGLGHTEEMTHV